MGGVDPEAIADPRAAGPGHRFGVRAAALGGPAHPVGPEPVLAYVASRKFETSMVRMLLVGKLAGVDVDTLRARVRNVA